LIVYRPFSNRDLPALAEIWSTQPPQRGLAQPMTVAMLEALVLAKPYFDREGLIVAVEDGRPVGFVVAGFGPTEDEQNLSHRFGVISLVMVREDCKRRGIGRALLEHGEKYLHEHGAQVIYGGGIYPLNPFFRGLYGGSELPGVLDSAPYSRRLFESCSYRPIDHCLILELTLANFRAPVDRQQLQVRRATRIETVDDPPSRSWWEACTTCGLDLFRFQLLGRNDETPQAWATFCNLLPVAAGSGARVGLVEVFVEPPLRQRGLATYLLAEAFRRLRDEGVTVVEVQTMEHNAAAIALYQKLGFEIVDRGTVYRQDAS